MPRSAPDTATAHNGATAVTTAGLARLARFAPGGTLLATACSVLAVSVSLLVPAVAAQVVDRLLAGRQPGATLILLAGLLLVRVLAEAGGGLARVTASTRVLATLRYRLLRQIFALGLPGQRRYSTGDLVSRLTGNTATAAGAVPTLVGALISTASSLAGLVALWLIDWRLGAVFLLGTVPAVLLLRVLMNKVTSRYGEYLEHLGALAARLTDALAGSRTIRASGTARREIDRVLVPLPDLARAGQATWAVQRSVSWQVELVLAGIRVAVLAVAGLSVAAGRVSPGGFLATALYVTFALGFLEQVDTLIALGESRANAGRVFEVLAARPQIPADPGSPLTGHLPPGPGALSFRGVTVRLGDRAVLDRLDLDLPAGASVALVGRSGAGKSTLAMLAGRLLDPDEGTVALDGVAVDTIDPGVLRRAVAYAFDRPVLLGDTVRTALRSGRPAATSAEVRTAAQVAAADDFIRRLPHGYDTALADAPFSGGELQRLGLARAVVHQGRVLVMDDATSNLDTVTEAQVAQAMTTGLAGRSRLIVAHRATTAARADLVAWLDAGRIRAVQPHRTLWEREPGYRAVFATEPARPTEQPTEPARLTQPVGVTEPARPTEPARLTQPVGVTEPARPTESGRGVASEEAR